MEHLVYTIQKTDKMDALRTLLDRRDGAPILVFGKTKHGVKRLAGQLDALGYPVGALQGNLSQPARERVMKDFRSGVAPILVATNVAARGLDVEGIGQVINFDLPDSEQLFTHRVGRQRSRQSGGIGTGGGQRSEYRLGGGGSHGRRRLWGRRDGPDGSGRRGDYVHHARRRSEVAGD